MKTLFYNGHGLRWKLPWCLFFLLFWGGLIFQDIFGHLISVPSVSIFPWLYRLTFLDMSSSVKNFLPSWKDIPHQCAYYVQCNSNLKNIIPRTCNNYRSHMIENQDKSCKNKNKKVNFNKKRGTQTSLEYESSCSCTKDTSKHSCGIR